MAAGLGAASGSILAGGEPAGDDFLAEHGFEPPAVPPIHLLNDELINLREYHVSPILAHYWLYTPINAPQLLQELCQYKADLTSYRNAEQNCLVFRLSNEEMTRRRKQANRQSGQPLRRVR